MRKITQDAIEAFNSNTPFSSGDTQVSIDDTGATCLKLHGNLIAIRHADGKQELEISNAGWETNTTKERLNGLPGVSIQQKQGVWYLNGVEWDGEWITISE